MGCRRERLLFKLERNCKRLYRFLPLSAHLPRNEIALIKRKMKRSRLLTAWSKQPIFRSRRRSANLRSLRCSVRADLCRHPRFGRRAPHQASGSRRASLTAVARRRGPRSHRRASCHLDVASRAILRVLEDVGDAEDQAGWHALPRTEREDRCEVERSDPSGDDPVNLVAGRKPQRLADHIAPPRPAPAAPLLPPAARTWRRWCRQWRSTCRPWSDSGCAGRH